MAHQIKHWGLSITISLEGCTHRLVDVGNRVHTRNDSDEDVRGYVCKQAIAWKALPWSFIIRQNNRIKTILKELNIEVKPSRLLSACIPFRGLRYACPRLPTSATDVYCLPGKSLLSPMFIPNRSLDRNGWVIMILWILSNSCQRFFRHLASIRVSP